VLDWFTGLAITLMMAPDAWVRRQSYWERMRGKWLPAVLVGLLSPMAYILVLYALRGGGEVSQIAPLREMSLMIGTLAGFLILKEKVGAGRLLGSAVIIVGVVILARP